MTIFKRKDQMNLKKNKKIFCQHIFENSRFQIFDVLKLTKLLFQKNLKDAYTIRREIN
jgi:hypothetical protein